MEKLLDKNQREFKPGQLVRYWEPEEKVFKLSRVIDNNEILPIGREVGYKISVVIDYVMTYLLNVDYLPEIICEKFIVYIQSPVDTFYGLIDLSKKESENKDLLKNHLLKFDKDNWLLVEQVMYYDKDKTYKLTGDRVYIEKTSIIITLILEIF